MRRVAAAAMLSFAVCSTATTFTAQPAAAAVSITVTPSTGIVDGQVLHVAGTGFAPTDYVVIELCLDSFSVPTCADFTAASGNPVTGIDFPASARFTLPPPANTIVDCRSPGAGHTCLIAAHSYGTGTVATTPVAFDPAGALAPPPSVTVSPSTGLTGPTLVTVSGSDFGIDGEPGVEQCTAGATSPNQCDSGRTWRDPPIVSPSGSFSFGVFAVQPVILTPAGYVDCRPSPGLCELRFNTRRSTGTVYVTSALTFDPAASPVYTPATIAVAPATALTDLQTVRITGSGFTYDPTYLGPPVPVPTRAAKAPQVVATTYGTAIVAECTVAQPLHCRPLGYAEVSPSGTIDVDVQVEAVLWSTSQGTAADCRPSAGLCQIKVVSGLDQTVAGFAPINFQAGAPLEPRPTLTASPATGLVDGQVIDVDGAGLRPAVEPYIPVGVGVSGRPQAATPIPPPPFLVQMVECVSSIPGWDGCDPTVQRIADTDSTGHLAVRFQVATMLYPGPSGSTVTPYDCRVTACELRTADVTNPYRSGVAPLSFAPDGALWPPPAITVTPSTGLVDGQLVHVHGDHIRQSIDGSASAQGLIECAVVAAETLCKADAGPGQSQTVSPADDGTFDVDMQVAATFRSGGPAIDCRVQRCVLSSWSLSNHGPYTVVEADLHFGAVPVAVTPAFTG